MSIKNYTTSYHLRSIIHDKISWVIWGEEKNDRLCLVPAVLWGYLFKGFKILIFIFNRWFHEVDICSLSVAPYVEKGSSFKDL